ncbi:WD repeat-containing protein 54-like [Macrosteles quadrilineatus]|uniref:WD repeat-containing protein 54-like n=1 Tax=Macrosteles quadrilineatus TaxID=74068 RepID=UPI0023E2AB6D|nr:WD repeat-containing protein 54-like [Macrosteles quadrilineatus]
MYKKEKTLQLLTSASAIPNNLAVSCLRRGATAESIAVVHQGFINMVGVGEEELSAKYIPCTDTAQRQSAMVTQVMWCMLGGETVLAITSTQGLQIFDPSGLECRFSHPCEDASVPNSGETFARGLAIIADEFLCVGNATGSVRVFGVLGEDWEVVFVDRKQEHVEAITDLAASSDLLASADEGGAVVLWNLTGEELLKSYSLPDYGSACTSLRLHQQLLLAGYGSGHLRLFSVSPTHKPVLMCEVAAHARWLTAIDVATDANLALSVSEDSFIRIWEIKGGDQPIMQQKFYTQVEDAFLVGGRFLTKEGSSFCVSSYDSNLVQCYKS